MDELHYYALRLTPYPNTEAKTILTRARIPPFMTRIGAIDFLFGQEYERNHHFHIVFTTDYELNNIHKKEIRDSLYTTFEVPQGKKGNPSYSLEPVRKVDEALSYAVKDGNFESSNGWVLLAADSYENSHQKTHSMKSSLSDLSDRFIAEEINERDLWAGLGQSRADLGLPLSIRWIDEMVLSIKCKKDPELLAEIWEKREMDEAIRQEKKSRQ